MNPYPIYKQISIPWIKQAPEHWESVRVKFLLQERSEKGYENEPLLAATQTKGVIPKELYENRTVTAQKDLHLLKLVEVGDFVISLRSFQGGIEYAYYRGIISPAYTTLKTREKVFGGFLRYLFKSEYFIKDLGTYVTGIREGQNIDYSKFKNSFLSLPSASEQKQIADYLDYKVKIIDKTIAKKKELVDKYRDKINVIVQAGIAEPYKNDKVVEWKYLPLNWAADKAKRIFIEIKNKNFPDEELLAATQDKGVIPKSMCEQNFVSPSSDYSGLKLVEPNDFVISLRSFQGGIEYSAYKGIISPAYTIIRLKSEYRIPEYINYYKYLFKTPQLIDLLNTAISGIRDGKNINWVDFCNLVLPVPKLNDVKLMDKDFTRYEKLVENFEREKILLEEYKTSLIAEVVTGQIDVRDWQPKNNQKILSHETN